MRRCEDKGVQQKSIPPLPPSPVRSYQQGYQWEPPIVESPRRPLMRSTPQAEGLAVPWLGGVCAGLAAHLGFSVALVRTVCVVAAPLGGVSILLYLWLWFSLPQAKESSGSDNGSFHRALTSSQQAAREMQSKRARLIIAGVVAIVASIFMQVIVALGWVNAMDCIAISMVVIGIGLVWSRVGDIANWKTPIFLLSACGGVVLLVAGLLLLSVRGSSATDLVRGAVLGGTVMVAIGIAVVPLWLRSAQEVTQAREDQVREAERADIAAHLHDSVLQTLTLIRSSADDPVRVRALSLGQERELRAWLYTGREEVAESLAGAVKEAAGTVESTYGVPVNVVTVGDCRPGPVELAMVAAGAEAMANAVRHGAPPVSVYLEVTPSGSALYVKDCGSGFDLEAIPEDRHGVRHSIIGRMERAGGSAEIRMLATGTEVHMSAPPQGS